MIDETAKAERERIVQIIHSFCRGETMVGKGCGVCPIEHLNVCNDFGTKTRVDLTNLNAAEKIIAKTTRKENDNDPV